MAEEALGPDQLGTINDDLARLSRLIYGERASFRVVDPKSLRLLKKNAHFMKKTTFDQLVSNVEKDGMLSSIPLCHEVPPENELEVLSGNHRVQSAIKAKLDRIVVLVIPTQANDEKVAKQLSHNALVGQDDKQILAELWKELRGIEEKLYAGLDSTLVGELEKIKFTSFNAERIRTESIALWFLPEEVEALDHLLDEAVKIVQADAVYAVPLAKYKTLFDQLVKTKRMQDIKNTAVAFGFLIDRLALAMEEDAAKAAAEANCAGSSDSAAPVHQAGEGGASPTPALSGL